MFVPDLRLDALVAVEIYTLTPSQYPRRDYSRSYSDYSDLKLIIHGRLHYSLVGNGNSKEEHFSSSIALSKFNHNVQLEYKLYVN